MIINMINASTTKVPFEQIRVGDCFLYRGGLYLRTDSEEYDCEYDDYKELFNFNDMKAFSPKNVFECDSLGDERYNEAIGDGTYDEWFDDWAFIPDVLVTPCKVEIVVS